MPFQTSALTNGQITAIRANGFSARQYALFAPNTVVFRARVNQSTFTDSFVYVDYDTVTTGTHTNIKEGFTVYIGATADIRQASFIGYIRRDDAGVVATATSININQTSAVIQDNWYITVTKDVRLWYKLPRWIDSSTYYKDWSITFRRVRPLITGLQSAYAKVLSSGIADFAFAPSASAVDADATSSFTWLWDADGGTFQSGTSTTKDVTIRYTTAGHYMPRVTVTDSNGVDNWFTFHVFVVPANYSSVVTTQANGASIEFAVDGGNNATIQFFDGVDEIPDYTFCALWYPNNLSSAFTSDIWFVGRLRNEQIDANRDPIATYTPRTSFQIEGISAQMGRLFNAGKITLQNEASPTRFDQIENLTPLRGIGYYLSEHTTLTNTHSLLLDDLTNTYLMASYSVDQASVLEQCNRLLNTTNRVFEYAPTGEIRTGRKLVYETTSNRNSATTVHTFTTRDLITDASGGVMYSISQDMVTTIGRLRGSGGAYIASQQKYQPYQSMVPAVAPTDGDDSGQLTEQILTANVSGFAELGERTANAFAEAQPPVLLTAQILPAYMGLVPSLSRWYVFDIPEITNNRGITYSSERWLLTSLSAQFDPSTGFPRLTAVFRAETEGSGYQTIVQIPPEATDYPNPVMPITNPYPNLPTAPDIFYPDPDDIPPEDMPPFDPNEIADVTRPNDPGTNHEQQNSTGLAGMAWSDSTVYSVTQLGALAQFADVTPSNLDGLTVRDGKLSRFDNKGYVLASDGTTETKFFRTNAFGAVDYAQTELFGDYQIMRTTGIAGRLYIGYGTSCGATFIFDSLASLPSDVTLFETRVPPSTSVGQIFTATYYSLPFTPLTRPIPTTSAENQFIFLRFDRDFECDGSVTCTFRKLNNNTMFQYIYTSDDGVTWTLRDSNSWGLAFGVGNYTLTWTNSGAISYRYLRVYGYHTNFQMVSVTIGSGTSGATTRYTNDNGSTFGSGQVIGTAASGIAGMDAVLVGTRFYASQDGKVRQADSGGAYSDATGGTTTGTYPLCIVAYGTSSDKYILASVASVSGESVWRVVSGTPTAITPNDGTNDGIAVSPNCIAMADGIETHIVGIFSFGGTRKIAYSTDTGATWAFNTQVSNSANYIRMIRIGTLYYIAICDGSTLWWGTWSGSGTLALYSKTAPQSLGGFEFR